MQAVPRNSMQTQMRSKGEKISVQSALLRYVGQKRHHTGTFDSSLQFALVLGAGTGCPARRDHGTFQQVVSQEVDVFVIDYINVPGAEFTIFFLFIENNITRIYSYI